MKEHILIKEVILRQKVFRFKWRNRM